MDDLSDGAGSRSNASGDTAPGASHFERRALSHTVEAMRVADGYLNAFHYRDVPLRWHWTLPVCLVGLNGLAFRPVAWLATLALVLLHEAGKAAVGRQQGLSIVGVDLKGLGGEPRFIGDATLAGRVRIAWAGVAAQAVALFMVLALMAIAGGPADDGGLLAELASVYTRTNLLMIGLALLPLPGFDGEVAWLVIPRYRAWWAARHLFVRTHRLHIVEHHEPPTARERMRILREIDDQIQALADAHNAKALKGPPKHDPS